MDPLHRIEMKTVVANRVARCDTNENRYGYALYVNDWNTNDRTLKLDIGTPEQGCISAISKSGVIPYAKWTQVGFIMSPHKDRSTTFNVWLYVNGARVASSIVGRGDSRSSQNLRIGTHLDDIAPFVGNISEVVVWNRAMTGNLGDDTLNDLASGRIALNGDENGLEAYYPLSWPAKAMARELTKAEDLSPHHVTAG